MVVSTCALPWTAIPVPKQALALSGHVDIGAVKLSYWDAGGPGEVVVLNHPNCQGSACWAYQQPALAAAGYRVIAWARRGTDTSVRGLENDLATVADDLRALLDKLGIDKCHLLGAAEGAAGVLHFAIENPARVRSAVLLGARLFVDEDDYRSMNERACLAENHHAEPHFFELGPSYRGANREGLDAWIANSAAAHPDGASELQPFELQPWGGQKLTWARMEQLKAPVLLLAGDADHYSSAAHNRLFAQHLPNRELAVIDEAGASAYWEQPDAFNAVVLNFLDRHRDGKATPPLVVAEPDVPWIVPLSSHAPMPRIVSGPVKVWDIVPVPEQVPTTEAYADTKPVKIWFSDTGGSGEAIVFCHPWSQSNECWKYQQPVFAKAGYRVIGWSARGFFKTEKGPQDDVGSSAEDLHQLIETLGLKRFHLIGCAAGGCTAISSALNHPERLHSLILSGTILLPDEAAYKEFRGNLDAAPPTVNTNIPVDFREVGASYRAGSPELYEEWRSLGARAHPNGWYLTQPWGAERNFKRFAAMPVPTLLQTGDTDMSSPPSLMRLYMQHFPNCELRVLREAGHASYWEQPKAFNASVLEFVGRHGAMAQPREQMAASSG
jgi:pimeloyl-ACP methyl ester carboxylesterase